MMFETMLFLQSYGFFQGGGIGDILNYWEQAGFFTYVLPFLLIVALVYASLGSMKLFQDAKGVTGVVSVVVGLLALQFNVVPLFFSEIFPRVGIALSVMLAILIILGMFLDPRQKWTNYMLLGMAVIVMFIVLFQQAFSTYWYDIFYFFSAETFAFGMIILIVVISIAVIFGIKPKGELPFHQSALYYPHGTSPPR